MKGGRKKGGGEEGRETSDPWNADDVYDLADLDTFTLEKKRKGKKRGEGAWARGFLLGVES